MDDGERKRRCRCCCTHRYIGKREPNKDFGRYQQARWRVHSAVHSISTGERVTNWLRETSHWLAHSDLEQAEIVKSRETERLMRCLLVGEQIFTCRASSIALQINSYLRAEPYNMSQGNLNHSMRVNYSQFGVDEVSRQRWLTGNRLTLTHGFS